MGGGQLRKVNAQEWGALGKLRGKTGLANILNFISGCFLLDVSVQHSHANGVCLLSLFVQCLAVRPGVALQILCDTQFVRVDSIYLLVRKWVFIFVRKFEPACFDNEITKLGEIQPFLRRVVVQCWKHWWHIEDPHTLSVSVYSLTWICPSGSQLW